MSRRMDSSTRMATGWDVESSRIRCGNRCLEGETHMWTTTIADSDAGESDGASDGAKIDTDEEPTVVCDPSGTWEVVVDSAALPGEGCQGGNPGQGQDTQVLLVEKNPITGVLLGTVIDPPAAGGVVQTLSVKDVTDPVEGKCGVQFVLTASIYLPRQRG